jgi:transcription termination/antitermination protein NusG
MSIIGVHRRSSAAHNEPSWYALRTRSNFEKHVVSELALKGVDHYLPCLREIRWWKDRRKEIEEPLFRGYVFTRFADNPVNRLQVLKTLGAVNILGQGAQIEPIPDAEIDSIRAMLAANVRCFVHPFLREGCRVRVRRGPLKGLEGLLVRFKNDARLVISVNLLSQSVAAEIDIGDVQYCGVS